MYVSQLIYSNLPDTDYSMINDCIGQIKNLLLSTGLVSVISDNNPYPNQKRSVIFKVGISNHYLRIIAYNTLSIEANIRNLANTTNIYGIFPDCTVNNTYADLLYGNNNLVIMFNNNINTAITYLKISSNDALLGKCSTNYFYSNVDDNIFNLIYSPLSYKTITGKWLFFPVFVAKESIGQIDESLQPIAYCTSNVIQGRIYRDENGRYYACVSSNLLVPDI